MRSDQPATCSPSQAYVQLPRRVTTPIALRPDVDPDVKSLDEIDRLQRLQDLNDWQADWPFEGSLDEEAFLSQAQPVISSR